MHSLYKHWHITHTGTHFCLHGPLRSSADSVFLWFCVLLNLSYLCAETYWGSMHFLSLWSSDRGLHRIFRSYFNRSCFRLLNPLSFLCWWNSLAWLTTSGVFFFLLISCSFLSGLSYRCLDFFPPIYSADRNKKRWKSGLFNWSLSPLAIRGQY